MRYNLKKIIPGIVLAAMLLSMAPIGAPVAHAAEPASTNITCNAIDTCILFLVYWAGPGIAGGVAYIGAYFFSIVVQLSLNSTAYALDFLSTGWTTVRDIANMAFIFILIYIALTVMLAAETSGTIKTLAVVVVIALLVNFSFFFTRVVIDAGNIVAVQFYNAIPLETNSPTGGLISGTQTKDLSLSIMGAVQLQKLYGQQAFDQASKACGGSSGVTCALIVSTAVYISVAAMLWMLFFAFLQVGIKFMMRIVGLWFVLIASPLAFVARTMPKTKHFFDQWLDYLIKFSFYPAIFLFMFWILIKFTVAVLPSGKNESLFNSMLNASSATDPTTGITTAIATVAIRMGFVIAVLYVGLKVSDWIVKEGSAMAAKITGVGGKGLSFGAGKVIQVGGASSAWALRNTVGRGATAAARSQLVNRFASKSMFGTALKGTLSTVGSAQMDIRNAPGGSVLNRVVGAATGAKIDSGKPTYGKGGFAKQIADKQKAIKKRAESMKGDAVDIQKAQNQFKNDYEKEHGSGSYKRRIDDLSSRIKSARNLQTSWKRAAAQSGTAEIAKEYLARAKEAEKVAKGVESELKPIADAGKDAVKERDKEFIGSFAKRMESRHLGNFGMPSRAAISGAADATKLVTEKSAKDKMAAAAKELTKEDSENEAEEAGDKKEKPDEPEQKEDKH